MPERDGDSRTSHSEQTSRQLWVTETEAAKIVRIFLLYKSHDVQGKTTDASMGKTPDPHYILETLASCVQEA